ncbi:class II glutamine amidotransferase [Pseudomonas sp. gcc21]|uniref:class II glutamine amidotransferase n=1 Tax=Pseudomonas sp. gcc21 TaxID=2726989 RepID=UPI00145229F3|nr:class II glutamine amidotransferase [Pseudomonas sp. gcc21]QJD58898.1 class II glutamine amidotransferase [Pseudomonas sp. gcc21]
MCELMGMSANVPTDICFSFAGLMQRGGGTGPHGDGWGVAFYEGLGVRCFHDPQPCHQSAIAQLVESYPIKSENVICHIRQANVGRVGLVNTHPFIRELWGRYWTFAHNGQLHDFAASPGPFQPVGSTDSEALFCDLLNTLRSRFGSAPELEELVPCLAGICGAFARQGVCNLMISNGEWLFTLCTTKLAWITRRAPFGPAQLSDRDLAIDFQEHTTPNDVVTVIATEPLTSNETWQLYMPGEWRLWCGGKTVMQGNVLR